MKLRLFALRDTQTKKRLTDEFFHDKATAKRARDLANTQAGSLRYVVTYGPDHRRNAS